ncbi:hypothetical protein A0J61_09024, partial [Choanephora cucurbitarum]
MSGSSSLIMKKPIDDMVTMFHKLDLVAEREPQSVIVGSLLKTDFAEDAGGHYSQSPVNRMVTMDKLDDIADVLAESIDIFDLEVDRMS